VIPMDNINKRARLYVLLTCMMISAGCASILLTGAGGGIGYTLTNIAYKTVGYPLDEVTSAIRVALISLDISEKSIRKTSKEVEITAETSALNIDIDLELITDRTTKITVDARKSFIFKDKATATAIIEETELILKRNSDVSTSADCLAAPDLCASDHIELLEPHAIVAGDAVSPLLSLHEF
jgi:archaellin